MATESTGERKRELSVWGQEASGWWHRPKKGVGMSGIRKCGGLGWDENTGLFCKPVRGQAPASYYSLGQRLGLISGENEPEWHWTLQHQAELKRWS